ncbi:MAG: universal stress protein [Thermodesulfobacteriota bacterium]
MYRQILVPVDGSSTANLALQEAIKFVRGQQATLRIIHVVDLVTLTLGQEFTQAGEIQRMLRESGEAILKEAEMATRQAGVPAETRLIELQTTGRHISSAITEEARKWPADLIVIGTHGRRGIHHLLMGSVAEGVIRTSPKPVLLIRGQGEAIVL